MTAAEAGVPAAEGEKMFCGHDIINASQDLACQAGVPVTLTFKARAACQRLAPRPFQIVI